MKTKNMLAGLCITCAALAAQATDRSDLWWNANESGWGMTIAQQDDILFITMYVYGSDSQPTWYVGPATQFTANVSGVNTFDGPLYRVTGPYFGATFNPSAVNVSQVGTVRYRALSVTTGQVIYNVGSVQVTKNVERQTFRSNPNIYGTFNAVYVADISGCSNPAFNGRQELTGRLTVTGNAGQTAALFEPIGSAVCSIVGPYTQSGRMGRIGGTIACPSIGISGTSSIFEIEAATNAFTARVDHSYSGCREIGRIAGVRR